MRSLGFSVDAFRPRVDFGGACLVSGCSGDLQPLWHSEGYGAICGSCGAEHEYVYDDGRVHGARQPHQPDAFARIDTPTRWRVWVDRANRTCISADGVFTRREHTALRQCMSAAVQFADARRRRARGLRRWSFVDGEVSWVDDDGKRHPVKTRRIRPRTAVTCASCGSRSCFSWWRLSENPHLYARCMFLPWRDVRFCGECIARGRP